ncbi:LytR/AlgR family response regulator transcription factor [Pedobacter borealis]|uniref:LytR/AlgR family response regulator transcription factor n=1 Tax=Pedobacter borealis TaxID=475254 RepID=UPI000492FD87|nr:LytTR family DNA-binding domain-containing protein [Pedobacter borealis]
MYTCFAIDDECSALEILTDYIALQPNMRLIKAYRNPMLALKEIEKLKKPVDIIFLDIEMPEINGIELAKLIRHKAHKLVFTTAHSNYAISSYEIDADGFLLKPISPVKFTQATQRLLSPSLKNFTKPEDKFIVVKNKVERNGLIKIEAPSIIAVQAQERMTRIYTTQETLLSNSTFSEVWGLLRDRDGFIQVHRSFIISENHIKSMARTYVVLGNDLEIAIGRKYAQSYYRILRKR